MGVMFSEPATRQEEFEVPCGKLCRRSDKEYELTLSPTYFSDSTYLRDGRYAFYLGCFYKYVGYTWLHEYKWIWSSKTAMLQTEGYPAQWIDLEHVVWEQELAFDSFKSIQEILCKPFLLTLQDAPTTHRVKAWASFCNKYNPVYRLKDLAQGILHLPLGRELLLMPNEAYKLPAFPEIDNNQSYEFAIPQPQRMECIRAGNGNWVIVNRANTVFPLQGQILRVTPRCVVEKRQLEEPPCVQPRVVVEEAEQGWQRLPDGMGQWLVGGDEPLIEANPDDPTSWWLLAPKDMWIKATLSAVLTLPIQLKLDPNAEAVVEVYSIGGLAATNEIGGSTVLCGTLPKLLLTIMNDSKELERIWAGRRIGRIRFQPKAPANGESTVRRLTPQQLPVGFPDAFTDDPVFECPLSMGVLYLQVVKDSIQPVLGKDRQSVRIGMHPTMVRANDQNPKLRGRWSVAVNGHEMLTTQVKRAMFVPRIATRNYQLQLRCDLNVSWLRLDGPGPHLYDGLSLLEVPVFNPDNTVQWFSQTQPLLQIAVNEETAATSAK